MKPPKHPELRVVGHVTVTGNTIAKRRKELGLTQELGAVKTGLTLRQFQRAEAGTHRPRLDVAFAIAAGLETTIDALFIVKIGWRRITTNGD